MKKSNTVKMISAEEFDQLADSGSDHIGQYLDWEIASRLDWKAKRINIDLPDQHESKDTPQKRLRNWTDDSTRGKISSHSGSMSKMRSLMSPQ